MATQNDEKKILMRDFYLGQECGTDKIDFDHF